MIKNFLLILTLALWCVGWSATFNVCAEYDSVKAAYLQTERGDTILIRADTAVWDSQLTITHGVRIIGCGANTSRIISNWYVEDQRGANEVNYLIRYQPTDSINDTLVLKNIYFELGGKCMMLLCKNGVITPSIVYVAHNYVHRPRFRCFVCIGQINGVIDSNTVYGDSVSQNLVFTTYGSNALGWTNINNNDYGSSNNIYFEDNIVYSWQVFVDGGAGGRYCIRHNRFIYKFADQNLSPFADMHGNQPTGNHAGMLIEIYENELDFTVDRRAQPFVDLRGGKGLIYNNHITSPLTTRSFIRFREEYNDNSKLPAVSPLTGQPQHITQTYTWGNRHNDTTTYYVIDETVDYANSEDPYYSADLAHFGVTPQLNRDIWIPCTTNCDGSFGVDVGLFANAPTPIVDSIAYWATDSVALYRAIGGEWVKFYEPYAYPHPLRTHFGEVIINRRNKIYAKAQVVR